MTKWNRVTAAIRLLMMLSCVLWMGGSLAHAQTAREPVLALTVAPDIVPAASLQGALEAELGVGVELTAEPAPHVPLLTVVRLPSGNIEVALSSRSVPRASRQLVLSAELASERVETLSLIAANLVRNEAAALLPDLRPAVPPTPAASEAPPAPRAPSPSPCDLRGGGFGFDFAPGVGSSSTPEGRSATRRVSLGFIGTLSGRLHGAELSVGVNIQRLGVCGAQLAAGANLSLGSLSGAQFAEFNLVRGALRGAQFGSVNLVTERVDGVQAGVVNGAGRGLTGAQLGVANYAGEDVRGVQAGVLNLGVGALHGAQLGVGNFALSGTQITQLGVGNVVVGGVRGLQLGVVNVAAREVGTQIGVFNYADRSDASIGLVSIVRRGRTSVDLTGAIESGTLMAGVTHGGRYVHNVYGIGVRKDEQGERLAAQLGIGVRALSRGRVTLDVDAVGTHIVRDGDAVSVMAGVRVPVTVRLVGGLGAMIAPSYQVLITDDPDERAKPLFGYGVLRRGSAPDDTRVIGFGGLTLGLRYQFDHGA